MKGKKFSQDEVELVVERLMAMPQEAVISMGIGHEPMDKNKLIEHVREQDETGKKIIQLHLSYLRSQAR